MHERLLKGLLALWITVLTFCFSATYGQQRLNLADALALTKAQSPEVLKAETNANAAYWGYRQFKSNYLPQLSVGTASSSYNRSIQEIEQPDGSLLFRSRQVANSSLGINLSQTVGPLGGTVFASSSINRIDNFNPDFTQFQTVPVSIGYAQPILAFNNLRWQQRIQPVEYKAAQKRYHEEVEQALLQTVDFYFAALDAQINIAIARQNVANNDTLFKIAQGRYGLGRIGEDQLLQMELQLMNSRQSLSQSQQSLENAILRLRLHLGFSDYQPLSLNIPSDSFPAGITANEATEHAFAQRSTVTRFEARRLRAQSAVAQAVGETGITGSIRANLGLNQQGTTLGDAYQGALDQQLVSVQLSAPIIDWGRTAARRRVAEAQQKLDNIVIDQEAQSFNQSVSLALRNYENSSVQLIIARRSNQIAQQRFEISKQRYLIGKITVTDLNIAQQEKDQAQQSLTNSLRNYYVSYYNLRGQTMWDWQTGEPIVH